MISWAVFGFTGLGCLLCGVFLVLYRPSQFQLRRTLTTVGWELVLFLVLLRSTIQIIITHGGAYTRGAPTATQWFGLVSLVLIDALIVYRLISFNRYRRNYNAETERLKQHDGV